MGRPSLYTPELAEEICRRLADGESLRAICRDDGMPDCVTVRRWLAAHEPFRTQYARARQDQADSFIDAALEIADSAEPGRSDAAKLQVDTRKWAAARMAPKRWGDSSALTLQNPDGSALGFAGLVRSARVEAPVRGADPSPSDEPV